MKIHITALQETRPGQMSLNELPVNLWICPNPTGGNIGKHIWQSNMF